MQLHLPDASEWNKEFNSYHQIKVVWFMLPFFFGGVLGGFVLFFLINEA